MNFQSELRILALIFGLALSSGCATITSSETQPITVTTQTTDGQPVEKADCSLKNEFGSWQIISPSVASVRRSASDLMVECKKEGYPDGLVRAISRAAGGMWGNIILFAGIGAIVDHNTGTGYEYPNELRVMMGKITTIDKRDEKTEPPKDAKNENSREKNDGQEKY